MSEAYVTKKSNTVEELKDDSVFLLNDVESALYDKPAEKIWRNGNMNKLSAKLRNGEV